MTEDSGNRILKRALCDSNFSIIDTEFNNKATLTHGLRQYGYHKMINAETEERAPRGLTWAELSTDEGRKKEGKPEPELQEKEELLRDRLKRSPAPRRIKQ